MKIATLAVIMRDGKLLLGEKKTGEIGIGKLSGPGGKLEEGESPEMCVIRETEEELGVALDPKTLTRAALIDFYAAGELDFRVHVYRADIALGEPKETADMIPGWYPLTEETYARMYESDRLWMGKVVDGERFNANVFYRDRAKDLDHIEFFPPNF